MSAGSLLYTHPKHQKYKVDKRICFMYVNNLLYHIKCSIYLCNQKHSSRDPNTSHSYSRDNKGVIIKVNTSCWKHLKWIEMVINAKPGQVRSPQKLFNQKLYFVRSSISLKLRTGPVSCLIHVKKYPAEDGLC